MTDELRAKFTLVVDAPDADDTELSELTLRLKEIVGEQVDDLEDHTVPPVPGSKAGAAVAINAVDVIARPGLLSALVDAVRSFVSFGSDRRVEVAFQVGDRPMVVKALANELPVVLKALNEYQEFSPRIKTPDGMVLALGGAPVTTAPARSGGVDVNAEHVDVEGSVVGRDQVWSAGGHIIIAKEGAQVIINGEKREYAEFQ